MVEKRDGKRDEAQNAQWVIPLAEEEVTRILAARLAPDLRAGDLVTLGGALGTGKTTFARALIRTLMQDEAVEVPSPTYTLMQLYEADEKPGRGAFRIVHADLYRIRDARELTELGWEEAAENALVFVEWAENAGTALADDRLDIHFAQHPDKKMDGRIVTLTGYGNFAPRLKRMQAIAGMLDAVGFEGEERSFLQGDASARTYETVREPKTGRQAILMIAPKRPDGPPIRQGKPYSALVHLAESVDAFVAMALGLRTEGFSAPAIYAANLPAGLLLVEDLGREGVVKDGAPLPERYLVAAEVLASLHGRSLPVDLPVAPGITHHIPPYDKEALTIEAELLLDWYWPYATQKSAHAALRHTFLEAWNSVLTPVLEGEKTWVLRDYHSPNLIWLPEREGVNRIGLIDFQDCVIGHPAYDLVSLTQDARVNVPEEVELTLLSHYIRLRRRQDAAFDLGAFSAAYATLGAQRATKILGIFVRLDRRDGKSAYLAHLPRIEAYLKRCLAHPALAKLNAWYEAHLPGFASGKPTAEDKTAGTDGQDETGNGSGGGSGHADAPPDGHIA
jgi:N-acetylmuramate 1-kinase